MAQLTPQAFTEKIKAMTLAIGRDNLPLKIAAQTVHALRVLRIFHRGIDRTGGKINPAYNKGNALYVPNDKLRRSAGNKGKTGKTIKTNYFKSYYALKRNQGFDPNTVNLRLTNNLQSDFANVTLSESSDAFPANAAPIKITPDHYVERLDRQENVNKFKGLSRKYNRPFSFFKPERTLFEQIYIKEMNKILSK